MIQSENLLIKKRLDEPHSAELPPSLGLNMTSIDGNGADAFESPNLIRPLMNRISA